MPYPNEHSCRLLDPDQFVRFFRKHGKDDNDTDGYVHTGKAYDLIIGYRKDDTSDVQAHRYPKDDWTEAQARKHCKAHAGKTFEPASSKDQASPPDREVRIFRAGELRADAEGNPVIEGKAAVYNVPSEDLGFIEVIEPGFFDDVLEDDVRGLFNHDPNFVLGRRSAGTLELKDSPEALGVTIHAPKTDLVKDLVLEPMRRGDINQMSFAFNAKIEGDEWIMKDGKAHRFLKKGGCAALYDTSVVTHPAYPQTSAQVRSRVEAMQSGVGSVQDPPQPAGGRTPADEQARVRHANRRRRLQLNSKQ